MFMGGEKLYVDIIPWEELHDDMPLTIKHILNRSSKTIRNVNKSGKYNAMKQNMLIIWKNRQVNWKK